jgi:hypothetical protein
MSRNLWTFAFMGRRSRYSQKQKFALIEEWIASGDTQQSYCKSKNISHDSFKNCLGAYRLRHKIPSNVRTRDYFPRFVSVEIENQERNPIVTPEHSFISVKDNMVTETYTEIQITYPTGTSLRIGSQLDLDQLRTLLTLL